MLFSLPCYAVFLRVLRNLLRRGMLHYVITYLKTVNNKNITIQIAPNFYNDYMFDHLLQIEIIFST